MDYFSSLLDVLNIEKEFDRRSGLEMSASMSIAEKRANGFSWYPVIVKEAEPGKGDLLRVELERTSHFHVIHQFRTGMAAALFSNADPRNDRIEGVVSDLSNNTITINFREEELPDWAGKGKLGIDLLFDQTSYEEMERALRRAAELQTREKDHPVIQVLTNRRAPGFSNETGSDSRQLNHAQNLAVSKIIQAEDLAIVHGPPGTGKTTVLTYAILKVVRKDSKRALVVAPSNTAVDLLCHRLSALGLAVVRIGNPSRVDDAITSMTLDHLMQDHDANREIRRLKKQATEYRKLAGKYKRSFGQEEREQRKALYNEAKNVEKEIERLEQYMLHDILESADIVAATLVGANHYTIRNLRFETVFIDEAGQALEPAVWIPVLKCRKVVMAGDHCQLPPTIKSAEAEKRGLGITLMEKCVQWYPEAVVMLDEQYRMHEKIMHFSSGKFYSGELKAFRDIAGKLNFPGDEPFLFLDTAGCGFEEKREDKSICNPEEAGLLIRHLVGYLETFHPIASKHGQFRVGIISPYKHQVELLKDMVSKDVRLETFRTYITVSTIDGFQGQECDIIYIGMVRSNLDGNIGFLSDLRRMNVAMTRARTKLVIVGDSATLGQAAFYADLISYAQAIDGYKTAWEFADLS